MRTTGLIKRVWVSYLVGRGLNVAHKGRSSQG